MFVVIDTTVLTWLFAVVGIYYTFMLGVAFLPRRDRRHVREAPGLHWLVLVPCRNEAAVIEGTLRNLPRRGRGLSVVVIDDGSTDATGDIARRFGDGVTVLTRRAPDAGLGKGAALNHAFDAIVAARAGLGPLAGRVPVDVPADRLIITVLDADGRFDDDALVAAARRFDDPDTSAVQLAVTIENQHQGWLPILQDVEFIGFSQIVQRARDRFGSLGLGGNGQFVRLSALQGLGDAPWSKCLTEDLDLGLRLVLSGSNLRFAHEAAVRQQGVRTIRALVRQRTRWAQGHLSCWRYLPKLLDAATPMRLATRLDLSMYLVLIALALLVGANLGASLLGAASDTIAVGNGVGARFGAAGTIALSLLGMVPAFVFIIAQQQRARIRMPWWKQPVLLVLFVLYTYIWIVAIMAALYRLAIGRDDWVKTSRVADVAAVVPAT